MKHARLKRDELFISPKGLDNGNRYPMGKYVKGFQVFIIHCLSAIEKKQR